MKKFMMVVLLMLASTTAMAGEVDNFVEVGADVVFYDAFTTDTDLTNSAALNARWGTFGATGLYAWGSYEQPEVNYTGVKLSKVRTFGLGGGLRIPFDNGMYAFTELGYYSPSSNSGGVDVKYDGNFGGSVGLGYDITENWTVNTKYRFLKIDSKYNDTEMVSDMTSINLGVSYRF
jgi:opacity protein-like surface antigen